MDTKVKKEQKKKNPEFTEIRLEICRNLGNYETVRYSIISALNGSPIDFEPLKTEIDKQHEALFRKNRFEKEPDKESPKSVKPECKQIVNINTDKSSIFQRILNAYKSGRCSIEEIEAHYNLTKDAKVMILATKINN